MKNIMPLIAGVLANLIFGTTFYAITLANNATENNPLLLLAYRFILGSIALSLPIIFKLVKVDYKNKPVLKLFFISLLNPVIGFFSETAALTVIPSSQLGVLTSLTPIVAVGLSVLLLKEKPSKFQISFMMLSIVGVMIINAAGSMGEVHILGLILVITYMFSNSLYRIYLVKTVKIFTAYEFTYLVTTYAGIIFAILSLSNEAIKGDITVFFTSIYNMNFIIPAVYLSLASTVVAMWLLNYLTANLPMTVSSALSTITPVISVILGVGLLNEPFGINDFIGASVILISVLFITMSYGYKKIKK